MVKELIDSAVHHVARNASRNTSARPLGRDDPRLVPEVAQPAASRWWPFWRVSYRTVGLQAVVLTVERGVVSCSGASVDAVSVPERFYRVSTWCRNANNKLLALVTPLELLMSHARGLRIYWSELFFHPCWYPIA